MNAPTETLEPPSPADLRELQRLADQFLRLQAGEPEQTELRVVAVIGEGAGLRVVEVERDTRAGYVIGRRLLFFSSVAQLRQSLDERIAWRRADAAFVATHMSTPGFFAGITHDWVPPRYFGVMFAAEREALRARICRTAATGSTSLATR